MEADLAHPALPAHAGAPHVSIATTATSSARPARPAAVRKPSELGLAVCEVAARPEAAVALQPPAEVQVGPMGLVKRGSRREAKARSYGLSRASRAPSLALHAHTNGRTDERTECKSLFWRSPRCRESPGACWYRLLAPRHRRRRPWG
jgi:hypothetical protein